jgi:hypothetical protein
MPHAPDTPNSFPKGLDYFRQAAEDASRMPPVTREQALKQMRRNREQRRLLELVAELMDAIGENGIEKNNLTTLAQVVRSIRPQPRKPS